MSINSDQRQTHSFQEHGERLTMKDSGTTPKKQSISRQVLRSIEKRILLLGWRISMDG